MEETPTQPQTLETNVPQLDQSGWLGRPDLELGNTLGRDQSNQDESPNKPVPQETGPQRSPWNNALRNDKTCLSSQDERPLTSWPDKPKDLVRNPEN